MHALPTEKTAMEEAEEEKLHRLREAIEPAWQQADRSEFADYSLERSLAKLRTDI